MPVKIRKRISKETIPALLGVLLFFPLFVLRRLGPLDFWWWMSLNLTVLIAGMLLFDSDYRRLLKADLVRIPGKKILLGVFSAGLLYLFFLIGNTVSRRFFGPASQGIDAVYAFKSGASVVRIALLMGFLIGPGEELFWRGGIQRLWQNRFGRSAGFLWAALLYAGVHLGSGNIMLVTAAAVCGLFWGWLYRRYGSVLLNVVSHTLWDLAVFLLWPFQ